MRTVFGKIAMAICLTFAVGAISSVALAPAAQAAPDKKEKKSDKPAKTGIEASLGDLDWGMGHDQVIKILAEKINADYRAKVKGSTDESYADLMRKSYTERADNMRNSYMQLMKDNVSNLSVSIVGEEFMPDNNESMLTQKEDIATKYYFFLNDQLYKMAVVYDSNYIGPIAFDTFCATTAEKYGKANDEVWDDDANFLESIWKQKDTDLTVKNKYASYSTFLMVFSKDSVNAPLIAQHKKYYNEINSGPEISGMLDLLTQDSDDAGSSVDDIIGKKTSVDLYAGLSPEDRDIAMGKRPEQEVEKEKKAKAKKNKPKPKKNDAKAKAGLEIF